MSEGDHELELLRAENRRLRAQVDSPEPAAPGVAGPPRQRWRTALCAVLLVVGLVSAPAGIILAWAGTELSDTDRFVDTLAPVGRDPAVQSYLADQLAAAVDHAVDIDNLTQQTFGALTSALPPGSAAVVNRLEGSTADGLRGLLDKAATKVITSDQFPAAWDQLLRTAHQQLTGLLSGNTDQVVRAQDDQVVVNLGPLLAKVKTQLEESGFPLTQLIPTGDHFVTVATVPSLPKAQAYYQLALLGAWLVPLISVVALAGAVVAARRRSIAVAVLGAGLLVGMLLVLVALGVGRGVFLRAVSVPATVSGELYDALIAYLVPLVTAVAVLGGLVCAAGIISLPAGGPLAVRRGSATVVRSINGWAIAHEVLSPKVGAFTYRYRVIGRIVITVAGAAVLLLVRPLTPGLVIGTALVAGSVAFVFACLQTRPGPIAGQPVAGADEPTTRLELP